MQQTYSQICPAVAEAKAALLDVIKSDGSEGLQAASDRYIEAIRECAKLLRQPTPKANP